MTANDSEYRLELGKQLRAARERRNLTRPDLAKSLRVSPKTIERAEAGSSKVSWATLEKLATALEVNIAADLAALEIEAPVTPAATYDTTEITTLGATRLGRSPGASPWLAMLVSRLAKTMGSRRCCERLPPDASARERAECLELGPLLLDWPREVLESNIWACVDTPLANTPPLPLDRVWIDLEVRRLRDEPGQDIELPDLLDGRRDEIVVADSPEFVIDRLGTTAVVFGRPGSGKTSLLKWLMRETLRSEGGRYRLPLFVRLHEFAKARRSQPNLRLLDFALSEYCRIDDPNQRGLWIMTLESLAGDRRDNVLILLDGWDELEPAEREASTREIARVSETFGVILTSRHTAPPTQLQSHSFFEIVELSANGTDDLITRWFSALQRDWQANELRLLLAREPRLAHLSRNPFTLTLLCALAYQADRRQPLRLPTSRSSVYERAMELLIREHNKRGSQHVFDRKIHRELEALAMWLFQDAEGAPRHVFDASEVADQTDDPELLTKVLEPARLVCQVEGRYGDYHFVHTSYLEYFVARALAGLDANELERRLLPNLFNLGWLHVTHFLVGGPAATKVSGARIFETLLARSDRFDHLWIRAAHMLAEIGVSDGGLALLGEDIRDKLWAGIIRSRERSPERDAFRSAFALLDIEDLVARTLSACNGDDDAFATDMGRMLRELPSRRAVEQLMRDLASKNSKRSSVATYGGARVFTTNDLAELRKIASDTRQREDYRARVLLLLGNLRDLAALELLERLIDDAGLGEHAIQALGRLGGKRAALVLQAALERSPQLRLAIYKALGETRSVGGRRELLVQLEKCGLDHDDALVLLHAMLGIPLGTQADVLVVERHLRTSRRPEIRAAAANVLQSASADSVDAMLAAVAQDDKNALVRLAALEALREYPNPSHVRWLDGHWRNLTFSATERAAALAVVLQCAARFMHTQNWAFLEDTSMHALEHALSGSDAPVRRAAVAAADALGTRALPLLQRVIRDRCDEAEAACQTLGRISSPNAAKVLYEIVAAHDGMEHSALVAAAAQALSRCAPTMLLDFTSPAANAALEHYAIRTGSLVFDDHIIDARGRRSPN